MNTEYSNNPVNEQDNHPLEKLRQLVAELELERQTGRTTAMLNRVLDSVLERQEGGETNFLVLVPTTTMQSLARQMLVHLWAERDPELPIVVRDGQVELGCCTVLIDTCRPRGWYGFVFEDHSCIERAMVGLLKWHGANRT